MAKITAVAATRNSILAQVYGVRQRLNDTAGGELDDVTRPATR